jgi:hypothetical protein
MPVLSRENKIFPAGIEEPTRAMREYVRQLKLDIGCGILTGGRGRGPLVAVPRREYRRRAAQSGGDALTNRFVCCAEGIGGKMGITRRRRRMFMAQKSADDR